MIIVITGGTGSLGKILAKKLLKRNSEDLIRIISRDEQKQALMEEDFSAEFGKDVVFNRMRFMLGDVRDAQRMKRAFYRADIVFHLAALKIVPAMEYNPEEALETNVVGTLNVARAASDCGAQKAVFISSDKAVDPVNLYGVTKRAAESMWLAQYQSSQTKFVVARYGNVVGSRGSVLEVFRRFPKDFPITAPDMTRFWWTLDEASEFVLSCAFDKKFTGKIFVPKLKSSSMGDFAKAFDPDASWRIIGKRRGEKFHETIISEHESYFDRGGYLSVDEAGDKKGPVDSYRAMPFTSDELKELLARA